MSIPSVDVATSTPYRRRVLVIASTFPAAEDDGTPGFIRDLSIELAREFDVLVLVPAVPGAPCSETIGGVEVRRFRYFPRRYEDLAAGAMLENVRSRPSRLLQVPWLLLAEWRALRSTMRSFQPDVLHVHWLIPQGIVSAVVGGDTPRLLTTLGGDLYALNGRAMRALKRWVLRQPHHVTVMNADMADRVAQLGFDGAISVLPMGANVTAGAHAAAAIEPRPGRIVFAGRLVEKKGVSTLIEAMRLLEPSLAASLVVVGDGPLREELQAAAGDIEADFVGQVSHDVLLEHFAAASVAVFPSVRAESGDQDGLPVAMLDAMATGTAVVASSLPGLRDAVEDGQSGLLVDPGSPEDLARAITELLQQPERARRMADAALSVVNERYSMGAVGRAYAEIIDSLAEGHHGSAERQSE